MESYGPARSVGFSDESSPYPTPQRLSKIPLFEEQDSLISRFSKLGR